MVHGEHIYEQKKKKIPKELREKAMRILEGTINAKVLRQESSWFV